MVQMLVYHGAYAFFPFLALAALAVARGGRVLRWATLLALVPACILAWSRFIEPAMLNTKRADIMLSGAKSQSETVRIALFADTHFGKFGNALPMARIVDAVNRQDVDLVLIAGDMVYRPRPEQIRSEMAELARLQAPAMAILGNHDVGQPGPDLRDDVRSALEDAGVTLLEDEVRLLDVAGHRLAVSGLRDLWDGPAIDTAFAAAIPKGVPHITLAHNPDTAMHLPAVFDYDLMLSGHTHGGQVRLPFLFRFAIPCEGDWDKDMHIWTDGAGVERPVWVTPGTGMVGLPFRFLQPPRVDILTLHLPEPSHAP